MKDIPIHMVNNVERAQKKKVSKISFGSFKKKKSVHAFGVEIREKYEKS